MRIDDAMSAIQDEWLVSFKILFNY
jgi:hypothetical protein